MKHYGRNGIGAALLIASALLTACGGGTTDGAAAAGLTTTDTSGVVSARGANLNPAGTNSTAAAASATASSLNSFRLPTSTSTVTPGTTTPISTTPPANASGVHNLTLTWSAPSDNADGTPLTDLTGYKIRYGSASGNYTQKIVVANAGLNRYVVDNLPAGTYYFTISAYNQAGTESQLSSELATVIAD